LSGYGERLGYTEQKILKDRTIKLQNLSALLESLSFERVLERGYAVVFDDAGGIISSAAKTSAGQKIKIRFRDGEKRAGVE
jgi:exodeoxyribonuclease VII large subunit